MGRNHLDSFVGKCQQMDKPIHRRESQERETPSVFPGQLQPLLPPEGLCEAFTPPSAGRTPREGVFLCLPKVKPCIRHPPEVFH